MIKDLKPTEFPSQLHPVEHFLGSLKQAVYAGSWEASNIDQLKKGTTWRSKALTLGCETQGHTCHQQWRFDCFFSHFFLMATLFAHIIGSVEALPILCVSDFCER